MENGLPLFEDEKPEDDVSHEEISLVREQPKRRKKSKAREIIAKKLKEKSKASAKKKGASDAREQAKAHLQELVQNLAVDPSVVAQQVQETKAKLLSELKLKFAQPAAKAPAKVAKKKASTTHSVLKELKHHGYRQGAMLLLCNGLVR